jgi:Sigma-70 region 2
MDLRAETWERHHRAAWRFALHLCGDPTLADDLMSEAFVRASDPEFASILKKVGDARRLLREPAVPPAVAKERQTMEKARGRVIAQWGVLALSVLFTGIVLMVVLGGAFLLFMPQRGASACPSCS